MACREACGACCIAPSISKPYVGMPEGKAADVACVHLDTVTMRCKIWCDDHYPETCRQFSPDISVCGDSREEAIRILTNLEQATAPRDQG